MAKISMGELSKQGSCLNVQEKGDGVVWQPFVLLVPQTLQQATQK